MIKTMEIRIIKRYYTMNIFEAFRNWMVIIKDGEYSIIDENGKRIATKRAKTSALKSNYKYTIYINDGTPTIWVEPGYNPPFYIGLDLIDEIPKELWNTPQPSKMIGNMTMYKHQVIVS